MVVLIFDIFVVNYKDRIVLQLGGIYFHIEVLAEIQLRLGSKERFEFYFLESNLFFSQISDDCFLHLAKIEDK